MYAESKFLIAENQKNIFCSSHGNQLPDSSCGGAPHLCVSAPLYRGLSYTIFHCHWF